MFTLAILRDLGPYAWFILGALFLIAEVFVPGVNLIWFGAAATVTGLAQYAFGFEWHGQMVVFLLSAAALVVAVRLLGRRAPPPAETPVNRGPASMVGRELALAEPIVNGVGRALYGDGTWRVAGHDQPAGTHVRVVGIEASTLLVEPIER